MTSPLVLGSILSAKKVRHSTYTCAISPPLCVVVLMFVAHFRTFCVMSIQPTLFLGHGAGPMPLFNGPCLEPLIQHWKKLSQTLERPKAILMVSAYWEERVVTVTSSPRPRLFFDYFGFPPETYKVAQTLTASF